MLFDVGIRRPHEDWLWPELAGMATQRDAEGAADDPVVAQQKQHVLTASREVARSFHDIAEIVATRDIEAGETKLRLLISMMLLQFMQMLDRQAPVLSEDLASSKRTVQIFLKRLHHALDEDWTLENMAAECRLSRTQFALRHLGAHQHDPGALLCR